MHGVIVSQAGAGVDSATPDLSGGAIRIGPGSGAGTPVMIEPFNGAHLEEGI